MSEPMPEEAQHASVPSLLRPKRPSSFPVWALGEVIGAMVEATAEATQTDPGMAATVALSALAGAIGGRVELDVKPDWKEGLNLFTVCVAAPGERKSAVQAALSKPLYEAEVELVTRGAAARSELQTQRGIAIEAAERTRRAAARATPANRDARLAEAMEAARYRDGLPEPIVPRLVADDVTPEATAGLLAAHSGRLAIITSEGGIFETIAGRYAKGVPNLDVFLKGHSGDTLRVDRREREAEFVERPALTIGLMIPPQVLNGIGRNDTFRGRGLLARFLFCLPESKVGRRRADAESISPAVSEAYCTAIREIVLAFADQKTPDRIVPDEEALDAVHELANRLEPKLDITGELAHLADWGSKFVGAVCRISGLLHVLEHGSRCTDFAMTAETFHRAAAIGNYYLEHAVVAFDEMQLDPRVADAIYILEVISRLAQNGQLESGTVSERDLFTGCSRPRFRKIGDLRAPIALLIEHGVLQMIPELQDRKGRGRPPSRRYRVHPSAITADSQ